MTLCSYDGCEKPAKARGYCRNHYDRLMRNGTPERVRDYVRGTPEERFWLKTVKRGPDECWDWIGTKDRFGYGVLGIQREDKPGRYMNILAHRFSYILHGGDIPLVDEKTNPVYPIDHLCRNIACVNPAHMEIVTAAENTRRGSLWRGTSEQECLAIAASIVMRGERLTTAEFGYIANVSKSAARRRLLKLVEAGYIRQIVKNHDSYWEFVEQEAA